MNEWKKMNENRNLVTRKLFSFPNKCFLQGSSFHSLLLCLSKKSNNCWFTLKKNYVSRAATLNLFLNFVVIFGSFHTLLTSIQV